LGYERDYENKKRAVKNAAHTNGLSAPSALINSEVPFSPSNSSHPDERAIDSDQIAPSRPQLLFIGAMA